MSNTANYNYTNKTELMKEPLLLLLTIDENDSNEKIVK